MKSKILRALVSFLIAFTLWFIVISVEYTETELVIENIPIKHYGELDNKLQIVSEIDDLSVNLKLSGNRFTMNKLDKSDIVVWVNMAKISSAGEKSLSYEVEFLNGISGVEVISQEPSEIRITVAQRVDKDIPVKLDIINQDKMPGGFSVDLPNVRLEYSDLAIENIRVSGPKDLVDQITQAKITMDMTGQTDDINTRKMVELYDEYGNYLQGDFHLVTVSPSMLSVKIPVVMTKEIELEYTLSNVDQMPADFRIEESGITIKADETDVKKIIVTGPREQVELIAGAKVIVDMNDVTETLIQSKKVILCKEDGNPLGTTDEVTVSPQSVDITVPVVPVIGEKPIPVIMPEPLKGGGLLPKDVQVKLEFDSVTVKGSPSALAELENITLPVIKLSNETDSFVDRVYIVALPAGVQTLSGENEVRVKVSLTIPPVETKKFEIPTSRVEMINLPDDVLASIYDTKLEVWVQGRDNLLTQIRVTDIKVSVDLAGATESGYSPVTITIKNCDNVGPVKNPADPAHTYQLYIKIVSLEQIQPAA